MMKVAGYNYKCLGANWNMKTKDGYRIVCPPVESKLDISSFLSYSAYCYHSVWVTKDGHAFAIGDNIEKQIYETIPKHFIEYQTEVMIQDGERNNYIPISAVCGRFYTLYLVQSPKGKIQLAYVHSQNNGIPIFLNIGDEKPVALYGGMSNCAVITEDGSIIIITKSVLENPINQLKIFSLPGIEKALYVACCDDYIFALSDNGKIYQHRLLAYCPSSSFSEVKKLKGKHFVSLSGSFKSCFAVSDKGRVYGHGSNDHGKLGLGPDLWGTDQFIKIKALREFTITQAYAGCFHSLFRTDDDKVVGFGWNRYGELLTNINDNQECIYTPTVVDVGSGVTDCDVGDSLSAIYIGCQPPVNSPNLIITDKHELPQMPVVRVSQSSFPVPQKPKSDDKEKDEIINVNNEGKEIVVIDEESKNGSYNFWFALIGLIILSFYLFHS